MISATEVSQIGITKLVFEDQAFMFRATLRTSDLEASIAVEGQQIPIIVRPATDPGRYQIISGFRRATAMRALGYERIAAIVRLDLDDDETAFRAAIIENEQRQTYSDIDRALAVIAYEKAGWSSVEVADLMGLKERQKRNLKKLLTLPAAIQAAIDDPEDHFGATHGIELGRLARKYPDIDLDSWIARVNEERMSVAKMKVEVGRAHKPKGRPRLGSIFNDKATDRAEGVYRLDAVKIVPAELDEQEREQLRGELMELLKALG